jgi:hypothetical protein
MNDELISRIRRHAQEGGQKLSDPVTGSTIARAESELGFSLPKLLVRLYTEISNGGFGPGYGLLGLVEPCEDDNQTVIGLYRENIDAHENPEVDHEWHNGLILACDWGCSIYTCVDCNSDAAQIVTHDPQLTWTHWTLESWLEDWVNGVDIGAKMFGPPQSKKIINPFTGEPYEFKTHGRAQY